MKQEDTQYSSLTSIVKRMNELRERRAEIIVGIFSRGNIYTETQRKKLAYGGLDQKNTGGRLEQDELKGRTEVKSCMDL